MYLEMGLSTNSYWMLSSFLVALILIGQEVRSQGCEGGEIRLVNGTSPLEGRVEMCLDGLWVFFCSRADNTVSDRQWDYHEAEVVCRQVGLQLGVTVFRGISRGTFFRDYNFQSTSTLIDVRCDGTESMLVDCPSAERVFNCRSYLAVGVTCISDDSPLLPACSNELRNYTGQSLPFVCQNNKCLLDRSQSSTNNGLCDGNDGCGDCSDECHCDALNYRWREGSCRVNGTAPQCNCSAEEEFQCLNGFCASSSSECDLDNDCGDHSDETTPKCIALKENFREELDDRAAAAARFTVGVSLGPVAGVVIIFLAVMLLCMLVPRCPMNNLCSHKHVPTTVGVSGEDGERGGAETDHTQQQARTSPAPLY